MSQQSLLNTAIAVKAILAERGIENEALNDLVAKAGKLPSGEVLEGYNKLAKEYNEARSYNDRKETAENLVRYWEQNAEVLADRKPDINKVKKDLEYVERLENALDKLEREIEGLE